MGYQGAKQVENDGIEFHVYKLRRGTLNLRPGLLRPKEPRFSDTPTKLSSHRALVPPTDHSYNTLLIFLFISSGRLKKALIRRVSSSPDIGATPSLAFLASARNSGSRIVLSNADLMVAIRSFGTPGGSMNERSTILPPWITTSISCLPSSFLPKLIASGTLGKSGCAFGAA